VLGLVVAAFAQSPEAAHIETNGSHATLIADSARPLDSAAIAIAERFGIPVSTEDPPYVYRDDMKDVTAEVARTPNPTKRVFVPKGGHLEAQFALQPDGSPGDIRVLLQSLIDTANAKFPFAYRLDTDGDSLTLVPTHTRDILGRVVEITPLLDRLITIPPGTRTIAKNADLMADALSAQTGLHVGCCQGVVAGVPWGMREIAFEARNEPARSILKRLIVASLEGRPNGYYWLQRCDPLPSPWCFINLHFIPTRAGPPARQTEVPFPPNQAPNGQGSPWWDKSGSQVSQPK